MGPTAPKPGDGPGEGMGEGEALVLDAVAWVRGVRDAMDEETRGMSPEEFAAYVARKATAVNAEAAARAPNRRSA